MNRNVTIESLAQSLWAEYMKTLFGDEKHTADWEGLHYNERAAWMGSAMAFLQGKEMCLIDAAHEMLVVLQEIALAHKFGERLQKNMLDVIDKATGAKL